MDTQKNHNSSIVTSAGARPMRIFVDSQGNEWLCDKNVSADKDFASQGCWRTDMMAFGRND
jgi:streptogramin lyase